MKASAVLAQLTDNAVKGAISGLKHGDVNVLLYVAEGGAPPTPPTDAPAPAPGNCPFWCALRLCIATDCINNCDFCQ